MSSSDFDSGSMSGGSVCTGYLVWVRIVGSLYLTYMVLVDGPYGSVHMVFHNHPCDLCTGYLVLVGFVGSLAVGSIGYDGSSVGNLVWAGCSIVGNLVWAGSIVGSIAHSTVRFVCLGNRSCFRIGSLGIVV